MLGRRRLDCDIQFDAGLTLDTEDDFDPMGDGWEGHTLSGRLDGLPNACVDTMIRYPQPPETPNQCCYSIYGAAATFLGGQLLEADPPAEFLFWYYLAQVVAISAPSPIVTSFTAVPSSVASGGAVTLSWTTSNTLNVDIDNGVGTGLAASGSAVVNPVADTTYTLTAHGPGGNVTDTAAVTIIPAASITSFAAIPDTIPAGGLSLLTWTTDDATSVDIDNGVGTGLPANGNASVSPAVTTTYNIIAYGPGGNDTDSDTLTISSVSGLANGEVNNCELTYLSATQIRIETGIAKTSGGDSVTVGAALTVDITTAGANGLASNYTESANQLYDVWLITQAGGASPAGLLTEAGDALSGVTFPGSYVKANSLYLGSVANIDGATDNDIHPFTNIGSGTTRQTTYTSGVFTSGDDLEVLASGKATTPTAVDLTDHVTDRSTAATLVYRLTNSGTPLEASLLHASVAFWTSLPVDGSSAFWPGTRTGAENAVMYGDPALDVEYAWGGTPSVGMDLWVRGYTFEVG